MIKALHVRRRQKQQPVIEALHVRRREKQQDGRMEKVTQRTRKKELRNPILLD